MSGFSVSKGIPYTKKPTVGMYVTSMNRGRYGLWRIENVTEHGYSCGSCLAYFRTYDEAKAAVCEGNDWQNLGAKGHEVYKGDAVFNKAFKVEPWEHIYLTKDKIYFFIWDTRELTRVAKRPSVDIMPYLHIEKSDNGKPISKNGKWLHVSELEAEPVTFKTDRQMREAATEDDMVVADAANTSLAPDVSNTSGDLFQDADKNNRCRYVDDKCQVYWYLPTMQALFNEDMSHCIMHGNVKDCIRQFNLRKDMKANESYDKYKRGIADMPEAEIDYANVRCTMKTLEQRGQYWYQLGLRFEPIEGRPGWVRFEINSDKTYCTRLCKVLGELGYDGFKITAIWPRLAMQAGLASADFRDSLIKGNKVIKDSGEITIVD